MPGIVANEGPMLTVKAAVVIRSEADLHKEMICLVNPRDCSLVFIKLVSFFNRFLLTLMLHALVQSRSMKTFSIFDKHSSESRDVSLHK
jgi:hypothetical protein